MGVPNKGGVTCFDNVTSDVLFQRYVSITKLDRVVLKSGVRYKNSVNAKD